MLIQFSARNFKSFKDPFTLDLFTNKETAVSNIIKSNFKNTYASAVFYGANGSGKSNILKAYNMMRNLVLNKDKVLVKSNVPINHKSRGRRPNIIFGHRQSQINLAFFNGAVQYMNADNSLGFNQSSLILSLGKQTACKNSCINKFIKEDKHVEIAIKSKLSLKKDNEKILLVLIFK